MIEKRIIVSENKNKFPMRKKTIKYRVIPLSLLKNKNKNKNEN
jgi:hypothetical protein